MVLNNILHKDVESNEAITTTDNTIKEIELIEHTTALSGNPLIIKENFTHETSPTAEISTRKFHVIVGCFGNEKNSSRLIKKLNKKGYKAYKLDVHKNLHRVALATFKNKQDAILAQTEIMNSEKMSSWVLTK